MMSIGVGIGTAVKAVYQFCSSYDRNGIGSFLRFMMNTRDIVAAKFRKDHGCSNPNDENLANAYPYFIGVFDTVAALGRKGLTGDRCPASRQSRPRQGLGGPRDDRSSQAWLARCPRASIVHSTGSSGCGFPRPDIRSAPAALD